MADAVWRWSREDSRALAWIVLLPLLVALPQLVGLLQADPRLWTGAMNSAYAQGLLRGWPYVDPNTGFATQALGYRAMLEWLSGTVPWWNYYSGVGLPLAAEYQPGAFFPLTLLLLLPKGMALQHAALQVLTGVGTYGLLRQMGTGYRASLVGALLYSFTGALAWMGHAPATAIPFLPWMLWGIERAFAQARAGARSGWRLIAIAMALGLLCAFPETSYLSGLLAFAWAITRGLQLPRGTKPGYASAVAIGGIAGIAFSAPQVYAFFHFLGESYIAGHAGDFARAAFGWHAFASHVGAPYLLGPLMGYAQDRIVVETIWGGIGGYVAASLVPVAAYGFMRRRDAIAWLLLGWCALALGKSFGVEPAVTLMNLVPGVNITAFYRFAPPSWGLALVILAMRGLDGASPGNVSPWPLRIACAVAIAVVANAALTARSLWPILDPVVGLRNAAAGSVAWAALASATVLLLLARLRRNASTSAVCAVLVADAVLMAFIPTLSNPRAGEVNRAAIGFLQSNLGLQRFFTLGPIQPNYGAYYGIASINHNYLPIARRWVDWARAHLDPAIDEVSYVGNYPRKPGVPKEADALRSNLAAFQWVGVKYVIASGTQEPLAGVEGVKRAYGDAWMTIYELPAPKPYFESENGRCDIQIVDRENATARCSGPDRLVRRELYFPGWSAKLSDREATIQPYRELFQAVDLPPGASAIRFRYDPPHIGWAWLAMALAATAFAFRVPASLRTAPRRIGRSKSGPTAPPGSASP